jgi:hypothetical protein
MPAGRFSKTLPGLVAVAAFVAVGYAFTRAAGNGRAYRALKRSDPSAAELYLDSAEIWAGAGFMAFVAGAVAARMALRAT